MKSTSKVLIEKTSKSLKAQKVLSVLVFYDFVMWYVKNHYVETATGEALDRLAELTPIDPRQLLTLGPIKVGDK